MGVFNSNYEKQVLTRSGFSERDYLELFMQIGGDSTNAALAESGINSFIQSKYPDKQTFKSRDLKKLYKAVHEQFFRKYTDNPTFKDIFVNGDYNCATASAFYALILDKLSLNYDLRETPNHIYLVANPLSSNVIYETTTPSMKTFQVSDKLKSEFLDYLVNNKIISKEDAQGNKKNELFEKYFYGDEKIDKKKLAGLLYYNLGIDAIVTQNFEKAYRDFEKAYILYPSKRIEYLISLSLLASFADKRDSDDNIVKFYLRYLQLSPTESAKEMVKSYWSSFMQKNLFESPNTSKVYQLFGQLKAIIKDTALIRDMSYNYYSKVAYYHELKKMSDSCLVYLYSAYRINPENILVHELIEKAILKAADFNKTAYPDFFNRLNQYFNTFSFLDKKGTLGSLYIYSLFRVMSKYYDEDNIKEGTRYYDIMKELMEKEHSVMEKNEEICSEGLVNIYYYYVRHRKYKEAKQFLQTVLKFLPNSADLNKRMRNIDDILAQEL
ncbi:MAG: hypothetical protein QM727_08185 [Niabella sp.]